MAVAIILFLAPQSHYVPRGVLLPTQVKRSPTSPDVVRALKVRPDGVPVLGHINIEKHFAKNDTQAQQQIWALAKQMAAKAGANAVVIKVFQVGSFIKGHYIYVFRGVAVSAPSNAMPIDMEF